MKVHACSHENNACVMYAVTCYLNVRSGAILLASANICTFVEEAEKKMRMVLKNGQALEKFQEMMIASGVSQETAKTLCSLQDNCYDPLPSAQYKHELVSPKTGTCEK